MSDDLLEAETPAAPAPKKGLSAATIIGIALLLAVAGIGLYLGSFWQSHNSRIGRLKAKNGDFIQLEHRGDVDEFEPEAPRGRRGVVEGDKIGEDVGADKEEVKEPQWYDKYMEDMLPKPIQVVYWREPTLTEDDVSLLMEFNDLEMLSVNCQSIGADAIERFLTLPKLRRLTVQAQELDAATIGKWKAADKLRTLTLVNPKWDGKAISEIQESAKENETLKGKVNATASVRPSFGGA